MYMYVCMYVYMYVCRYICIYIYIYIYLGLTRYTHITCPRTILCCSMPAGGLAASSCCYIDTGIDR